MRTTLLRIATPVVAALALAACSGGAPASGVPTLPPLPSVDLPSIGLPTALPSINPDAGLESLFPTEIAGNAIDPTSATGAGVYALFRNTDTAQFDQFLSGLGATIDQVSGAMSFNIWPGPTEGDFSGITIVALRVANVDSANTIAGLAELVSDSIDNAQIGTQTIGGKGVTVVTNPENEEENAYLYGVGDVVFMVGGTPEHVEEAFTKLP